ncbi:MAG: hypothetical protein JNN30_17020 [Rhodanobacteraceae bacterium]|nr:hypothetical protein [Rhodanobacteraceae bacterium]
MFCAVSLTAGALPPPAPPPSADGSEAAPGAAISSTDAALLLYLSEFEDAQGNWIDPADLPASDGQVAEEDDDAR